MLPRLITFQLSLICDADDRLGRNGGAAEIKQHPFFAGVDFNELRRLPAPFKPELKSGIDTKYFPIEDIPQEDTSDQVRARDEQNGDMAEMSLPFIGYTFRRFDAFRGH